MLVIKDQIIRQNSVNKSKPRIAPPISKFDKSVLDRRVTNNNYNIIHDYTVITKNIGKDKLKGSKSSVSTSLLPLAKHEISTCSSKASSNKSSIASRQKQTAIKKFNSAVGVSKRRDKSFKRLKENEFRKLLRPANTNQTIDVDLSSTKAMKLNHATLSEIPSSITQSKSDQKSYRSKSRTRQHYSYMGGKVLREKSMNSVKCNLWTNDISTEPIIQEDTMNNEVYFKTHSKMPYADNNDLNLATPENSQLEKEVGLNSQSSKNIVFRTFNNSLEEDFKQNISISDYELSQENHIFTPPVEQNLQDLDITVGDKNIQIEPKLKGI